MAISQPLPVSLASSTDTQHYRHTLLRSTKLTSSRLAMHLYFALATTIPKYQNIY